MHSPHLKRPLPLLETEDGSYINEVFYLPYESEECHTYLLPISNDCMSAVWEMEKTVAQDVLVACHR